MWGTLKKIDEHHFPMIERSAINVRLVNLINYQFKIATEQRNSDVVQDLQINYTSLVQNFESLSENKELSIEDSEKLFKDGEEIISLLKDKKWKAAREFIVNKKFFEKLEDFSFAIYDSTENLAEQRDESSAKILNRIRQVVIISTITILFLIFLIRRVYAGYSENLEKRITAEERAKTLSKQRETLIHVLCHDLGNPVSAIFGLTEAAHLLDDEAKKNIINTIKDNAKESLDIIELTRKMQALETGKLAVEMQELSLLNCVQKSASILKQKFDVKKLELQINIDETLKVRVEETSFIHSILNNILTNSIKFSHQGDKIEVFSKKSEDGIELIIQDFGVGIPEDILSVLFSETEQTSRTGTDGEVGTGFGMPLVKKFMNAYGGEIIVESSTNSPDSGTKTTLVFVQ